MLSLSCSGKVLPLIVEALCTPVTPLPQLDAALRVGICMPISSGVHESCYHCASLCHAFVVQEYVKLDLDQ